MALALGNKLSLRSAARPAVARRPVVVRAAAGAVSEVPDMNKRNIMNLILLGGIGAPATGMLGAYALFFVPAKCVSPLARSEPMGGRRGPRWA